MIYKHLPPILLIISVFLIFLYRCLSRSQSSNRHAEWRARYIVQSNFVAELDRSWFATVFTTDTAFQIRTY